MLGGMSIAPPAQKPLIQRIRRWIVGVIIVSFAIAALGGIAVLLSGAFNETAGKVLGTTALTGLFSVAALCGVALFGRRAQWFGWVTVGIAIITLGRILWLIWAEPNWADYSYEWTFTFCILSAASAVAALLLLLSDHSRSLVRVLLYVTLGLIALGVLLSILALWRVIPNDSDSFWRGTGVVWILAALGVVVLPVMSLLLRAPKTPAVQQHAAPGSAQQLSPDSIARIEAAAQAAAMTPDEFVWRMLQPPEA